MISRRFTMRFVIMVLLLAATSAWAAGQRLSIQVREAQMRKSASFTSSLTTTLVYGETVTVLEERGDWRLVSAVGVTGWMHSSAFGGGGSTQYSAGSADASAKVSEREVSMAGKGFNTQVEQAYRSAHPEGYAKVDAMLRINYSPGELEAFLAAGKESRQGGAQ
jgi:hypothetical protein